MNALEGRQPRWLILNALRVRFPMELSSPRVVLQV